MKNLVIILIFILIFTASFFFYNSAKNVSSYKGLPTVACVDPTKQVVQNYSFFLKISINGMFLPLDSKIGHDYGNCLHDIFVNDSSGKVYVRANDNEIFTLGQFFDVWHKTFSNKQLFSYMTDDSHKISVTVDGIPVSTYRETVLSPNEFIEVIFR